VLGGRQFVLNDVTPTLVRYAISNTYAPIFAAELEPAEKF